jgi:hypothetical protein
MVQINVIFELQLIRVVKKGARSLAGLAVVKGRFRQ